MNCPKCVSTPLSRARMKRAPDVELDHCATCDGVWFDAHELTAVLGPGAPTRARIPPHARTNERLRCPRCATAMAWFVLPGSTTVLDACTGCGGFWLDAGEAKAVQAAVESPAEQMACPKCGAVQARAPSCVRCGVLVDRFRGSPAAPGGVAAMPGEAVVPRRGGLKEALLRFVNDSIDRLTS